MVKKERLSAGNRRSLQVREAQKNEISWGKTPGGAQTSSIWLCYIELVPAATSREKSS